jgi:AraC-like DNA-binding protein
MKDTAHFWIEPDLGGLECLRATYVKHAFAPHAHETFAIGVIEAGAQRVRHRGSHEVMPPQTVCVINPGELHTGQAATAAGWTYSMIYPQPSLLADVAAQLRNASGGMPFCRDLVNRDDRLVDAFLHFHAALRSGEASRLAKQTLLSDVLAALVARHAQVRPRPEPDGASRPEILRARDYLREHYAQAVSLDQLAALAGMSPFHFARSFRKVVGLAPHAYLLQRRIAEAKRLLVGGASIAQTAFACGFTDQSHLTNRFRAVLGVTPGQYRQTRKNLQDGKREEA